jgi:hypothetical protein
MKYSDEKLEINVKSFNCLILFGIFGKVADKFNPLNCKKFVTLQEDQLGGD